MCDNLRRNQAGLSLIEVVVAVVVVGIALAGLMALYAQLTRASVDPMVRKQALAIAASLLEEIELKPFTHCDPDDTNVFTAPTPPCTTTEVMGPEGCPGVACETRYNTPRFDNVNDYQNFQMGSGMADTDVKTVNGAVISELAGYAVSVAISDGSGDFTGFGLGVDANDALKIVVTVTHPGTGISVGLQGYRLRYAPNSP